MTQRLTHLGLGLLLASFAGQAAAEMPAVSSTHVEAEASAGFLGEDTLYTGGLVLGAPIGDQFGFQADIMGGFLTEEEPFDQSVDGDDSGLYGGGIQGFWRSPNLGMIGLKASYLSVEDVVDIARVGFGGQRYLGSVTLLGEIGYEYDDVTDGGVYAEIGVNAYLGDNFKLGVSVYGNSHEYDETFITTDTQGNAVITTFEFSPEVQAEGIAELGLGRTDLSLFALARGGNEMDFTAQLGLRWEIGSRWKSLRGSDRGDNNANQMAGVIRSSERLIRAGRIVRRIGDDCGILIDIIDATPVGGVIPGSSFTPLDDAVLCPVDDALLNRLLDGATPNPLPGAITGPLGL
ncbi:MAG: hypothetical protein ABF335_07265 [Alphaproteobacteria bacterium]